MAFNPNRIDKKRTGVSFADRTSRTYGRQRNGTAARELAAGLRCEHKWNFTLEAGREFAQGGLQASSFFGLPYGRIFDICGLSSPAADQQHASDDERSAQPLDDRRLLSQ